MLIGALLIVVGPDDLVQRGAQDLLQHRGDRARHRLLPRVQPRRALPRHAARHHRRSDRVRMDAPPRDPGGEETGGPGAGALARRAGRRWHEAPGRAGPRRTAVHRRSHRARRRACVGRRTGGTGSPDADSDLRPDHLLLPLLAEPESVADRLHRATRPSPSADPTATAPATTAAPTPTADPSTPGGPSATPSASASAGSPSSTDSPPRQPVGDRHGKPWRQEEEGGRHAQGRLRRRGPRGVRMRRGR